MYMNKICTDVIQSKKLIELGIDITTADMYYSFDYNIEEYEEDAQIIPKSELGEHFSLFPEDIPAWSLSALLDILAKETHNIDEDGYIVLSSYKGNWWDISPINCVDEEIKESNSPLDVAFEMVCRLLKNKKL